MTEIDRLDDLERELGPALRAELHRRAAAITEEHRLAGGWSTIVAADASPVELDYPEPADDGRRAPLDDAEVRHVVVGSRWRDENWHWHVRTVTAVAAAVVLLAVGALLLQQLALTEHRDVQIQSAKPNPTPTTEVVTPAEPLWIRPLLPREGPSSMPPTGDVVAQINIRHRGVYQLYADGRLIQVWAHREQRLTPDGVERVRTRFLSSGLFDSAQPPADLNGDCPWVHACVRDGARWLAVQVDVLGASDSEAPPEADDLFNDLVDLSWLPATELVDAQHKHYVPALIGTCIGMFDDGSSVPFDLPVLLSQLPATAAGVLADHERSAEMESVLVPLDRSIEGVSNPIASSGSGCFELTLDDARTLADACVAPSSAGAPDDGIELAIDCQLDPSQPDTTPEAAATVWFFELLPNKEPFDSFGD